MKKHYLLGAVLAVAALPAAVQAQSTTVSPTGGQVPAGVTRVGGIVTDLQGINGSRLVAQLAASSLYVGFANSNPQLIGTQSGFTSQLLATLGGGLQSASFRVTLHDGDSASGNFDFNRNTFLVDGTNLGNFSSIATLHTSSDGNTIHSSSFGFGNNILSTGWFSTSDSAALAALFSSLGDGSLSFSLNDTTPGDNYYDFRQGVDGGLINAGQGPVVAPPVGAVPEPATWAMMLLGFGAVGFSMRRRQRVKVAFATA